MADWSVNVEYIDGTTGTRMTIEYDTPEWPRITIFPPEPCTLGIEEINGAIYRLINMAGGMPSIVGMADPDEDEGEDDIVDEWQQHEWGPND